MSKYHLPATRQTGAGAPALCGSRNKDRYRVVCVKADEWSALKPEQQCSKCARAAKHF
jgi:hypothetical protein